MKLYQVFLTVLSFCFFGLNVHSQAICGFDDMHAKLMKSDPSYRKNVEASEANIRRYIDNHRNLSDARVNGVEATLYTIPVVVHVVHTGGAIGTIYNPTDASIVGAINYLNQIYNGTYPGTQGVGDIQIQFALATRDPYCNATTGIDRIDGSSLTNYVANGVNSSGSTGVNSLTLKSFDRWDPNAYYNIWVVNKIDTKDGTSGQFIAGFAALAGGFASNDGTIMLATQMQSGKKTLPHEIGHALGLYHPFNGSPDAATCPANTDCTTDGDFVCDTDPISYNQTAGVVDFTCRTGTNSCTGTAYSINTENNFMNYTSCFTLFTAGQKARMLAAMTLPGRANFASAQAFGAAGPLYPYVAPISASCTPTTSATGLGSLGGGLINVTVGSKTFTSDATPYDGGYVDKTSECIYLVPLQKGNSYTFSVTFQSQNREQVRAWIDYNNDGVFSNATEQIYYNADIPKPGSGFASISTSFTVPTTAATTTALRMRVLEEISTVYGGGFTITNACYNPTYGQAEDYPVYLTALLPVKFEYFKGEKAGNDALLSWKTSYEQNAKEFAIERSTDGISFTFIGTVAATNLPNGSIYSFTDKDIPAGVNYYRLRQIDVDLRSELSQVVIVKADDNNTPGMKVINNPFAGQLDVVFTGMTKGNSMVYLFDITGRKVFSKNYNVANGQLTHIDVSGLALTSGTYILQAQVGDKVISRKVVKQ